MFPLDKASSGCSIEQYPMHGALSSESQSGSGSKSAVGRSSGGSDWLPWNWLLKREKRANPRSSRSLNDRDAASTDQTNDKNNIFFVKRGDCMFEDKALIAQAAGAGAVVVTNTEVRIIFDSKL